MQFDPLHALSPIDGRYARGADALRGHLSEAALIRTRIRVEAAWFVALVRAQPPGLPAAAAVPQTVIAVAE
ncbi:MAG: adenylosuccinate lyase, partial [Gammaproteobacteria bacterium]